jgi:hypothetical protein
MPVSKVGLAPGTVAVATVGIAFEMLISAISRFLPAMEKALWGPKP